MHLAGNILSIPVTMWLLTICQDSEKFWWLPIGWMMMFLGGTLAWELNQKWGRWKAWWYNQVIDTFMDILSPNLLPWLILYAVYYKNLLC